MDNKKTRYYVKTASLEIWHKDFSKIKEGCTVFNDGDTFDKVIAVCDSYEEAKRKLSKYSTDAEYRKGYGGPYHLVTEYFIEEVVSTLTDDGEWEDISFEYLDFTPFTLVFVLCDRVWLSWECCVHNMLDDIREEVHAEKAPCSNQEFLNEYCSKCLDRYGFLAL